MSTTGKVVLDLDRPHLDTHPNVTIDGVPYALEIAASMPPLDSHRLIRLTRQVDTLMAKETLSEAEETELLGLPNAMCRLVLEAPDAVHAKLTDTQRMSIVRAFLGDNQSEV